MSEKAFLYENKYKKCIDRKNNRRYTSNNLTSRYYFIKSKGANRSIFAPYFNIVGNTLRRESTKVS